MPGRAIWWQTRRSSCSILALGNIDAVADSSCPVNAVIRASVQEVRTGFLEEANSKRAKWLGVNRINEQIILQRRNHFYGGLSLRQKANYYGQTEGLQSHIHRWEWVKQKFWASLLRIWTLQNFRHHPEDTGQWHIHKFTGRVLWLWMAGGTVERLEAGAIMGEQNLVGVWCWSEMVTVVGPVENR